MARRLLVGGAVVPEREVEVTLSTWEWVRRVYRKDALRGAFVLPLRPPPTVGEPLRLRVTLPDGRLVQLGGHVDGVGDPRRPGDAFAASRVEVRLGGDPTTRLALALLARIDREMARADPRD